MITPQQLLNCRLLTGVTSCLSIAAFSISTAGAEPSLGNPIGKVARLFNPKLVKMEERVQFLDRQLMSLAVYNEHVLKTGIGCRGVKLKASDPEPTVTLDLGEDFPIDKLYLVPVQEGGGTQGNIFPKRFTIELSGVEDFSESRILYSSADKYFPETGGKPVKFNGQGARARYVRLTVNQGQPRGDSEIFGISEIVVISDSYPVSFGCEVKASGTLQVGEFWFPDAVVDGRMPLGVWQGGQWARRADRGDLEYVDSADTEISWSLDLGEISEISLINLFPFDIREALEAGILPEILDIQVRNGPEEEFQTIAQWRNPIEGVNHETPLVFAFDDVRAREIRVVGKKAREVDGKFLYGLSEIEVWSEHKNLAMGRPVILDVSGEKERLSTRTNGFASNRQIIPVGSWLGQLNDRWRVENEIGALQPMRVQMASESELNATWGSAMMLGLTFLIPVFIVERRRLISRNQMDQLRKRIASDLHDDIGSNLGSISLIARTARKDLIRLAGPAIVGEDLNEVESIARESSLAMRDIVWLLERKQDSIGDLVQRMRETASRMLREIDYSIECDSTKATAKLSLDAKRHLFLFYKEAIHNIVKHSKATKITVRLWDKGDKLALEVIDNGGGLPVVLHEGKEVPQRVRKLDERARVLEGHLDIKTERDKGTEILLTVKRSLLIVAPALK
ncbi:histidine kinase [Luteolibacter sp. AS25]|uniref:histidine kinase n=1 Tax=Luteolibacter sp. AS25 TaxID=3135776 RepID=UPI00398B1D43